MRGAMPNRLRGWLLATSCLTLAVAALPSGAAADAADRTYLRGKLKFYYADLPNVIALPPSILDNEAIARGTEEGMLWTRPTLRGTQRLVRSLLAEPARGGDEHLQTLTARVIRILDKPVMITLLNDAVDTLTNTAMGHWDACNNGRGRAWPCASNMAMNDDWRAQCARKTGGSAPSRRDQWAGQMTLGESYFRSVTPSKAKATFIHELVHTQDRSDKRDENFFVSRKWMNYGADGKHFWIEAVPNIRSSYGEGIANTLAMLVDADERREMFRWFADNDVVLVERAITTPDRAYGPHPCSSIWTLPSPDIWLHDQLRAAGAREVTPSPNNYPGYAHYKIREIPARFIVHSEYIFALTFSEYAEHLGLGKFLTALKANDAVLFRTANSPIAKIYETLCTIGLEGRPLSAVQNRNEAGPKPYMIPLAYADFFTGYTARSKADYASIFENKLPQGWVDLYWDGYKDNVRSTVPIGGGRAMKFGDLTDIAIALGVNQSVPDEGP